MRGLAVTFWGLLQVAGCSVGKPSVHEVARIEAVTAHSICVGDLTRWHREFYFQPALGLIGSGVDKGTIHVVYSAGRDGEKLGRFVIEPPTATKYDDSQFAIASGRWDRTSGRFKNWTCGCSVGLPVIRSGPPACRTLSK
jgi:hypothetical protein